MASAFQCPDGDAKSVCLVDLPEYILHKILFHLGNDSLSKAAQTCTLLLRLAGNADLWRGDQVLTEDRLMLAAKLCLSRALHIPPQMFRPYDDLVHSPKFPIKVILSNLRGILGYPYQDGFLAHPRLDEAIAIACTGITEQIKRARQASQDTLQCAICPAAVFVLVRPERNSVRFELRQRPALTAILHGFEELGWPATLGESAAARLQHSRLRSSARSQLLLIRHLYGPYLEQDTSQPVFATVERVVRDAALAPFYWSLREGAQRCLKAADLQGKHPSLLGDWLGPTEALLQHATSRDMELMLKLRQFFPNRLPVVRDECNAHTGLHGHANTARCAAAALQKHCTSTTGTFWTNYEPRFDANGLVELADCLRRERTCVTSAHEEAPKEGVTAEAFTASGTAGHGAIEHKDAVYVGRQADAMAESEDGALDDHISRVLHGSDPTLVMRLRLKARLHLEVLRVMSWCFFMLGTEHEQQRTNAKRQPLNS